MRRAGADSIFQTLVAVLSQGFLMYRIYVCASSPLPPVSIFITITTVSGKKIITLLLWVRHLHMD